MVRPALLIALCLGAWLGAAPMARAECPATPGWQPLDFLLPGDDWLDGYWLRVNLAGHSVRYPGGIETYDADGSYRFTAGEQSWTAPAYRFYDNGARCIDYAQGPRVDYYILARGRLTLVTEAGERFTGLLGE